MTPGSSPIAPGGPDHAFHGRPTRRLSNGRVWVEVLATAGPRVVRLGLAGSDENLLAETPDAGWETPNGRYELLGGHRLWFAPEMPDIVAVPDADGLLLDVETAALRLTGTPEPTTGLVRSILVSVDPVRPAITLRHELANDGPAPIELAPWAITQLPLGGVILLPQRPAIDGHGVRPNRSLVLWPYTSWEDGRLQLQDGLMSIRADAGRRLKVGYFNDAGWVGYVRRGALLVRRFTPVPGTLHPDLGCNVEVYCRDRFLELELLGPLARLEPGHSVIHTERWEVSRVAARGDDGAAGRGQRPDEEVGSDPEVQAALAIMGPIATGDAA